MWVIFSLIALIANVAKVLAVKQFCSQIDTRLLVFSSRLISAIVLIPILLFQNRAFPTNPVFWGVILSTSILTAIASMLLTESIKKGPLSVVMPIQSGIPVFSLLALIFLFKERPGLLSIVLMVISMILVCLMLYFQKKGETRSKRQYIYSIFSILAAVIFGISTVLDPIAIRQIIHGALAYSACWNLISSLIMATTFVGGPRLRILKKTDHVSGILIYSLCTLAAFFFQQYAVQLSLKITGAVIHVKTLVMMHMPVVVLVGVLIYREKPPGPVIWAGLAAIITGIALIRSIL